MSAARARAPRRIRPGAGRRSAGSNLTCAVLSTGPEEWAAVDLSSGAFVRARVDSPIDPGDAGWSLLDVAALTVGADDEPPDPARPEGVALESMPVLAGRMRRRAARRLLRRLVVPERRRSLLGTHGPSVAYVDLDVTTPSIALIPATAKRLRCYVREDGLPYCGFAWSGTELALPLLDERVRRALAAADGVLDAASLQAALGGKPGYLLVGLGAVRDGHAPKVVLSVIARRPKPRAAAKRRAAVEDRAPEEAPPAGEVG